MKVVEVDAAAGTVVEREATAAEKAAAAEALVEMEAQGAAYVAAQAARESGRAKLAALGLTDAEIAALIGG